jgi:hypothetical protein
VQVNHIRSSCLDGNYRQRKYSVSRKNIQNGHFKDYQGGAFKNFRLLDNCRAKLSASAKICFRR